MTTCPRCNRREIDPGRRWCFECINAVIGAGKRPDFRSATVQPARAPLLNSPAAVYDRECKRRARERRRQQASD